MKVSKKHLVKLFKSFLPFLILIFLVFLFFWKVFLKKQIPFPGDFVTGVYYPWLDYKWGFPTGVPVKNPIIADVPSFIYPMQTFGVELMKKGQWPLWNPYILAGTPLLANLQSAPLSPTMFVYFLFDQVTAWTIQVILQHILVAFFTYLLLRNWKVSKLGSIFGGIIFAFSGFSLIWSQWNGHTLTAAFIPLLLLFEERWLKKGRLVDGFGVAIAFCFQFLSGYPQVILYTAVAAFCLWIIRIWKDKKWILKTLLLAIFFILGFGLSAPQLLTGAELLSLSQWTSEPHPFKWAFLPWQKIVTFIAPDYFGNHSTQNYWGLQDYTSNTGFVGLVAFILAGMSLKLLKKKKEVAICLLLLVVTLILSFPTPISVFLWKNNLFGMKSSSAHRALVLFNLSIALLAGFGLDLLKTKYKFKIWHVLPSALIILGFGLYALSLNGQMIRGIDVSIVALRNLVIPVGILMSITALLWIISKSKKMLNLSTIILLILLLFELFRFGWKFTPFSTRDLVFPETPVLSFFKEQEKPFRVTSNRVIPVNLAMPYKLESLEGYETMRPVISSQFLASLNNSSVDADPAGRYGIIDNDTSHLLDLVNTKYYLTLKRDVSGNPSIQGTVPDRYNNQRFKLAFEDKTVAVMESKTVLPRAFMVHDWDVLEDDRQILAQLLDLNFPMKTKIILNEEPGISKNMALGSEAEYLEYSEQSSLIDVNAKEEGLLFISDTYFPGWKVYIDGKEGKIIRANYAFRAVKVPKGKHLVSFKYKPQSFYLGLKIFTLSVSFILISLCISLVVNKKKGSFYT